jgi:hypothetical protein
MHGQILSLTWVEHPGALTPVGAPVWGAGVPGSNPGAPTNEFEGLRAAPQVTKNQLVTEQ